MTLNTATESLTSIDAESIKNEYKNWITQNKIQALWKQDAALWTNEDEAKWMGWLNPEIEVNEIPAIESLAVALKNEGITDIIVLGMGGSSLCPAMLAITFGKIADFPRLNVLDSTDPAQIHALENKINLQTSFFIVSSKSGTTLEPNIFLDYFYARLHPFFSEDTGKQFAAITDPNTPLEKNLKN